MRGRGWELGTETGVMAILNLTPDSFFAPSRVVEADVVERAGVALSLGADVLDLGAESTRPGAGAVPAEEEQARLLPALRALRARFPTALISVDTYHARTAEAALQAGADIVNDVTGLEDPGMGPLLAASKAGAVLMHRRGQFRDMHRLPPLADPLGSVREGLEIVLQRAVAAGVDPEQIVLDPGFGFGKNMDENLPVLAGLDRLHEFGRPLLAGVSRKSFLGAGGAGERLPASLAAGVSAVLAGAHLLRVHDVAASVAAARFADRLLSAGRDGTT